MVWDFTALRKGQLLEASNVVDELTRLQVTVLGLFISMPFRCKCSAAFCCDLKN